jgi:integrase
MFYTTVKGKQYSLNVTNPHDETGAWASLRVLIARLEHSHDGPTTTANPQTCRDAVEAYLRLKADSVRPVTLRNYARHLAHFADDFGTTNLADLDERAVPNKIKKRNWSDTNVANYLATVEACLKSAGKALTFDKPGRESAGAESVIPESVYRSCLRETRGDFHQLIRFLWSTGCRPSEATKLTLEQIDSEAGVVRLKQHKTRSKTGKPRLIFLSPDGLAIVSEQRAKHQSGHLFRGQQGKPLSIQAVVMRFFRLSAKVGHPLCAYDFRHTFATRALSAGVPDTQVAALLGHTNTTMIHRHYNHVSHDARLLRSVVAALGSASSS